MIYIKRFTKHEDYESYIASEGYVCPNLSTCDDVENEVHFNKCVHDYSKDYFTFRALEDGTFKLSGNSVDYSLDGGETWTTLSSNTDSPTVNSGETILWKASLTPTSSIGIGRFSSTGMFDVEGNPMSLLYGDNFKDQNDLTGKDYAFKNIFSWCTGLTSAENMSLPATTLATSAYTYMFQGCTSLTTAPSELPATTLANYCYRYMFNGCTSLTTAPELPATTLAYGCYQNMFQSCTSLTTAPELPATTLANYCYAVMFNGCTSLTTAPALPAKRLAGSCYIQMFRGCSGLTTAPELPATTLDSDCYYNMFASCTSLTTAPELPATTLANSCYQNMFNGCTNLNYIKAMFTTTPTASSSSPTYQWVQGVASTGTFVKNSAATWSLTGDSGIPNGWTVQDAT